jgi:uncharacterized RDD family membrane protein YckC
MSTYPPRDPTGVVGRRILAAIVDWLLLVVIFAFVWQSQAEYVTVPSGLEYGDVCDQLTRGSDVSQCLQIGDRAYFLTGGDATATWLGGLAVSVLIYVVLQGLTGFTPGKLLTGIRTVAADGSRPGLGRAALRWILLIVDSQPCGLPLVGLITSMSSKGHRRVGDMAAKTFVVRSDATGTPVQVPGLTAPDAVGGYGQAAWGGAPGGPPQGPPQGPPPGGWAPPPSQAGWGAPPSQQPPTDPGAQGGWQQPGAPGPESAPTATDTGAGAAGAGAGGDAPQWDEARGTYIQWDDAQQKWLQWDEASRSWSPIPGQ